VWRQSFVLFRIEGLPDNPEMTKAHFAIGIDGSL
jgi:hypothetical protein